MGLNLLRCVTRGGRVAKMGGFWRYAILEWPLRKLAQGLVVKVS